MRLRQPLLAVAHGARHLAGAYAHSSHSSHASHASHASHFSSSVSPPSPAAPTPTVPSGSTGVALSYAATLTTGTEISAPVGAAGASGRFTATLSGNTLHWRLTLSSLSSAVTGAYLFSGSGGSTGSPVRLCGPCKATVSGSKVLSNSQLLSLMGGQSYVNVGTQTNPKGEVGGQVAMAVTTIPAPVTPPSGGGGGGGHFSHVSHASHASHASHFSSG